MKKNMIALLLSIVMTVGSIGGTPVLAAETTAEETVTVEEETVEEATEISEEADTAESVEEIEEEPSQDATESAEDIEKEGNAELPAEDEELSVDAEEIETETEGKDAALVDSDDIVDSGECGENVTWTLTGTGDNLTLTISGSGKMDDWRYSTDAQWYSKIDKIKTVVVESDVTSIGNNAFNSCRSLTNITIPSSVTSIGARAFYFCSNLTSITIPDGVTSIGYGTFLHCSNLTSITIPDSVTSIGDSAFSDCDSLTSITIPDGVTSIGDNTFESCESLTSITIPDGVTSIGDSAFHYCRSLTNITIPDSVTYIGRNAFSICVNLTSITIPDGVTSIGGNAFEDCSSLTSITIPDSVTSIGGYAFESCSSLTSITIPDSVTSIGNSAFESCSSLTSITIPDSVTSIGNSAFESCSSLTSITIPDSVTSIGDNAFNTCSNLTSVTIPSSVTYIGVYAFTLCNKLDDIYYGGDEEAWKLLIKVGSVPSRTKVHYGYDASGTIEIDPEFTCNIGEQIQISATYRGTNEITSATVSADPDDSLEFSGVSIQGPVDNGNGQEMIISFMVTANKGGIYNLTLTASDGTSASTVLKVIDEYDISDAEAVLFGATYTDEEGNKCFNYTGEPIEPVYTVRFSNKPVAEKDKDYTMTYEDNTEIGIAKCILEGIGDYHGQKIVEFRIVAPRPEFISIESEFPGACTIVVNKLSKSAAYKLDIQKDGKSIKGYPKELVDDEKPDGSSATESFTEYADCLEEGFTYTIRCCAIVKIEGKDYQSDWREREVEISSVKMTTDSGYDEFFAPIQSITLELDFGKEDISFAGEGQIAIHDDTDNKDVWVFVPSEDDPTYRYDCEEFPGDNALANGSKLTITFNISFYPKTLDGSDFEGNIRLKADHKYHVSVKDGTILHGDKKIWAGIDNKDKLCFKTIKYQLPRYKNTGFEHHHSLAKEMAEQIYKPAHVLPIILYSYLDRGICTGMLQTILAWEKGYDNIHQIGNQVEDLGDLHKNETGGTNTTFRDYMIKAQLYSMSPDWINQKKPHDGDLNGIYQKASRGDDFIISFGSYSTTDEDTINHVLLPVGVKNNNSYDSIMVYDCSINDNTTIIKELRFAKSGGTYTGWALDGLGSDQANNYITWFELTDGMDQCVVENKQNLVYATEKLSHEAEGDLTYIRPANSISGYEDEGYLYWTDKNNLSFTIDAGSLVSLSDGYNKLEAFAGKGSQVNFDLETMSTTVITEEGSDEQTVELGYQIYTDYDESTKIKVTAGGSEQTTLKQTDDGWTLEGADPGTITIKMESGSVEDGEEITNTEEITVESTTGSVEMENDSDQTLHVYEDLDGDGSKDTEIGTVAMPHRPGITSIENASISGIEDKEYTGNALTQEPVVTVKGRTLVSGKHYTVSYENNINVGTAKVIITGTGKYTGTIEKEFEITAKEIIPTIVLSKRYFIFNRKVQKPNVTVKDGDTELTLGRDYTIRYTSDCTSPRPHSLLVDLKGNYTGGIAFRATFWIGSARIILPSDTYVYTSKAIKPTLTVKFGSKELTTSDYDVIWPDGCTKVGTYTVTVKLKGAYLGTVTKSYEITAKKITPTVTLSPKTYVYNGKVRKPAVTVKNESTKLATSNYTVTYSSGRKNPGTYKIVVKMKGNYSRSKAVSFKINPKGTALVSLTPASKKMTVKWKKQTTQTTGYQIQYATDSKFTKNKKSVTIKGATNTSKLITGLTGGKKYYVRIRTYKTVAKANYYSAWSAKKAVTVKK